MYSCCNAPYLTLFLACLRSLANYNLFHQKEEVQFPLFSLNFPQNVLYCFPHLDLIYFACFFIWHHLTSIDKCLSCAICSLKRKWECSIEWKIIKSDEFSIPTLLLIIHENVSSLYDNKNLFHYINKRKICPRKMRIYINDDNRERYFHTYFSLTSPCVCVCVFFGDKTLCAPT